MSEFDIYEKSLTSEFKTNIYDPFLNAISRYQMLKPGDHICVCISGGKDSMLMAKLFKILEKSKLYDVKITYLVMNPGYNDINLQTIKNNLAVLNINAKIVETNIFEIANSQDKNPCYICAKMRRGSLYNIAKGLGCNKIALGHHYDDVIETTLMNMLNSGSLQAMLPKLHSTSYENMELIRPLYLIREKDIIAFRTYHKLRFIQCACRFTENCAICDNGGGGSKRQETKQLIKELKTKIPNLEENIFNSTNNINLENILGYKKDDKFYHYNDKFKKDLL